MSAELSIAADARIRLRAALLSLVVATLMLAAKYQAYRMTGSTAVLSDALESIVNVLAAVFALGGLLFAGRPADRNHPYGHGKIEFFSAAFEGASSPLPPSSSSTRRYAAWWQGPTSIRSDSGS